jgi:hypothetical protein
LTPESRFRANEREIAAQIIGGEAILINLSSGIYYSMDKASSVAWALLSEHYSLAETAAAIAERYDVPEGNALADLEELAETLESEGIIELTEDLSPSTELAEIDDLPSPGQALSYEKVSLNIYRDMGELLALDPPMPGIDDVPWKPAGS